MNHNLKAENKTADDMSYSRAMVRAARKTGISALANVVERLKDTTVELETIMADLVEAMEDETTHDSQSARTDLDETAIDDDEDAEQEAHH